MTGSGGEGRPGEPAEGEAPASSRAGHGAPDGDEVGPDGGAGRGPSPAEGPLPPPSDAAVSGLGPLLRICVLVVAVALLAAVIPWTGADAAARAGVGVLLSAPYLATLSAAVHYVRERRWPEAALALLLLALLLVGLWIGTGRTP